MVSGYIAAGYSQNAGEEHLRGRREKDIKSFWPKKNAPTPPGAVRWEAYGRQEALTAPADTLANPVLTRLIPTSS